MYDALKKRDVLSYSNPAGHEGLRSEIATYLRRVRGVSDRTVLVTNGSQEALFMLAQLFLKSGDTVAVEALGYPPALEALKYSGARIVPIEVDGEGLIVEDLVKKLRRRKIKLLYTTPLHQYPTTVTLSATRRLELYEVAVKHGLLIVEDDYDHEFHYISQPVAPLASFDPAGIILYVSTFSKILFPSSRVGFLAVPEAVALEVAKLKRISSRQNEQILQATIAGWMREGGFERHLRRMRRLYAERCGEMLADLRQLQQNGNPDISWREPDGGMALWLDLGRDSASVAEKALRHDLLLQPEARFRLDQRPGTHLRLGFSGYAGARNRESLGVLARVLKGKP